MKVKRPVWKKGDKCYTYSKFFKRYVSGKVNGIIYQVLQHDNTVVQVRAEVWANMKLMRINGLPCDDKRIYRSRPKARP